MIEQYSTLEVKKQGKIKKHWKNPETFPMPFVLK